MSRFICVYRDGSGRKLKTVRSAHNLNQLKNSLLTEGIIPITIQTAKPSRTSLMGLRRSQEFADTLGTLLKGGITLKESISLMAKFHKQGKFVNALDSIAEDLSKGKAFHESLQEAPVQFPSGFVNLCSIGENSGSLAEVMNHLSWHYKRMRSLREKMITASIYPSLVLVVAILAGIFLSVFILPDIMEMVASIQDGQDGSTIIPAVSPVSVALSGVTLLLLLVIIWRLYRRKPAVLHSFLLNLPLLGKTILDWHFINWCFALELLSSQGMPMDKALAEAANTVGNIFLRNKLLYLAETVSKGETLSILLKQERLFPPILSGWVLIGERSGNIERIFRTLREHFEKKITHAIDLATQLVEPFMILVIGLVMLALISRFIIPIFRSMGDVL